MSNPRYSNGGLRRKHRARMKAIGGGCGICHGLLGDIHYDEPSDCKHPLSFVIDEKIPISKYYLGGYDSPREAAEDWNNLQPAHYICNQMKSDKINFNVSQSSGDAKKIKKINVVDGEW